MGFALGTGLFLMWNPIGSDLESALSAGPTAYLLQLDPKIPLVPVVVVEVACLWFGYFCMVRLSTRIWYFYPSDSVHRRPSVVVLLHRMEAPVIVSWVVGELYSAHSVLVEYSLFSAHILPGRHRLLDLPLVSLGDAASSLGRLEYALNPMSP